MMATACDIQIHMISLKCHSIWNQATLPSWPSWILLKFCQVNVLITSYPNHNSTVLTNFQLWDRSSTLIFGSLKIKIFFWNYWFPIFLHFRQALSLQSKIQRGYNLWLSVSDGSDRLGKLKRIQVFLKFLTWAS